MYFPYLPIQKVVGSIPGLGGYLILSKKKKEKKNAFYLSLK